MSTTIKILIFASLALAPIRAIAPVFTATQLDAREWDHAHDAGDPELNCAAPVTPGYEADCIAWEKRQ